MNRDSYTAPPSHSNRSVAGVGQISYMCAECGAKAGINKGEHIRCKECGHRVLYKLRTRRYVLALPPPSLYPHSSGCGGRLIVCSMVQFEAR